MGKRRLTSSYVFSNREFVSLSNYPVTTKEQVRNNLLLEGYSYVSYDGKNRGFWITR